MKPKVLEVGAAEPRPAPEAVVRIPLAEIGPDPEQPRKAFPPQELEELASSIRAKGVNTPIVVRELARFEVVEPDLTEKTWRVRNLATKEVLPIDPSDTEEFARMTVEQRNAGPRYLIVFGERRWRASFLAEQKDIPAIVRQYDEKTLREVQFIENRHRSALTAAEEGAWYRDEIDMKRQTVESLVKLTGLKRSTIYNRMALVRACPYVQEKVQGGELPDSIATYITRIPGHKLQERAAREIVGGGGVDGATGTFKCMSAREAEKHIADNYTLELDGVRFDPKDKTLLPLMGACGGCPQRSGSDPELYPDVKNPNVCMNPDCFRMKADASRKAELQRFRDNEHEVLDETVSRRMFASGLLKMNTAGFVDPDWVCPEDGKNRTWADLAKACGKKAPKTVVAVNDGWAVVELYRASAVLEACVAAKVKVSREGAKEAKGGANGEFTTGGFGVAESEEARAKREKEQAKELAKQEKRAITLIERAQGPEAEWDVLYWLVDRLTGVGEYDWERVLKRRGFQEGMGLDEAMARMTKGELRGLLFELHIQDSDVWGRTEGWNDEAMGAAETIFNRRGAEGNVSREGAKGAKSERKAEKKKSRVGSAEPRPTKARGKAKAKKKGRK